MTAHLTRQEIETFREGRAAGEDLLRMDEHLARCAECRGKLYDETRVAAQLASLRASLRSATYDDFEHTRYEQLAAYTDDRLDDVEREIVESHFAVCEMCASEARDLAELRRAMDAERSDRAYEVAPATPVPARASGLFARWRDFFSGFEWRPLGVAATAALLLSAGVATWLLVGANHRGSEQAPVARADATRLDAARDLSTRPNAPVVNDAATPPAPTADREPTPKIADRAGDAAPDRIATRAATIARTDASTRAPAPEELTDVPPAYRRRIERVVTERRLAFPAILASLAGAPGYLRGAPETETTFAPLAPVGEVTRSDRPVLRWTPLSGATGYTVDIYDANLNRVASSPALTATEWTPDAPLPRGAVYQWQITARRGDETLTAPAPPAPEARFKVLDLKTFEQLEQVRSANRDAHLLLGTLYAEAGLLDDAEKEFAALRRERPRSRVARDLHRAVAARRAD